MAVILTWLTGVAAVLGGSLLFAVVVMILFSDDYFFRNLREAIAGLFIFGTFVCGTILMLTWGFYEVGKWVLN